jgi:hypothetical protein
MSAARKPIAQGSLDGIPLFWAEAPGHFTASLEFRVGRSDETLPRAGITHLVEHLWFPTQRLRGIDVNGSVGGLWTSVWATGDRRLALDFLADVARSVTDLPLERLETERRVLQTEASASGTGPIQAACFLRFGPRGHGLIGYPEYGLNWLGPEDAAQWAARTLARENVALWMTGPPPDALELPLPRGEPLAPAAPEPIPYLRFPCVYRAGRPGEVSFSLLAPRSHALKLTLAVVEHRLRHPLRYDRGLVYAVEWAYEVLDEAVHVVFWLDTLEINTATVCDLALEVVDALAEAGPTEEELAHEVEETRRAHGDARYVSSALEYAAQQALLGAPHESEADDLRAREAVTPESGRGALAAALETLLLCVPEGTPVREGLEEYPIQSPSVVAGRTHRPRGLNLSRDARAVRLVVGSEGITHLGTDGTRSPVRWDECVAALRWADGTRGLWSADGFYVEVAPALWRRGGEIVAAIDSHVPSELVVRMEPEQEEAKARAEATLSRFVERGRSTSTEQDTLAQYLDQGETVVAALKATKLPRQGVLVLTDQRLLFLFLDELREALALADIRSVGLQPALWFSPELVVEAGANRYTFTNLAPQERVTEFVTALRDRLTPSRRPSESG